MPKIRCGAQGLLEAAPNLQLALVEKEDAARAGFLVDGLVVEAPDVSGTLRMSCTIRWRPHATP